ncbi:MAG: hypothetical protein HN445_06015 [Bacteroidetes Order II. Incertae sedis bacterium]|jgi:hypothetical protein|nr:hypothetical protein [Bacteroidetes Order II. bacterium]MBT6425490.1 hypothetical protein [Bacteroidetes Order II. bacterium]
MCSMHSGAHNLEHLTKHASLAVGVRRSELREGDVLMLYTRNSVYTARFLGKGRFAVTGGWFDLNTGSPDEIAITGSTWGGKCIHRELVASPGMRVEFGNRVVTSVLQRVVRIPATLLN